MGLLGQIVRQGVNAGAGAFRGLNAGRERQDEMAVRQAQMDRQSRMDAMTQAVQQAQLDGMNRKATPQPFDLAKGAKRFGPDNQVIAENPDTTRPQPQGRIIARPDGVYQVRDDGTAVKVNGIPALPAGGGAGGADKYVIKETPDGYVYVPVTPGEAPQPVPGPGGNTLQPNVSPALSEAYRANTQSMSVIDEALKALQSNPNAVGGWAEHMPAFLQGVIDPVGQATRNPISDVGSLEIKSRSGSAVNAGEMKRLGFVPDIRDPAPVVVEKLKRMRIYVQQQNAGMEDQFPGLRGVGSRESGQSSAGAPTDAQAAFERYKAGHP